MNFIENFYYSKCYFRYYSFHDNSIVLGASKNNMLSYGKREN